MPSLPRSLNWFIAGTIVVLIVPIVKVLVEYQTFLHPWRPELAASLVLIVCLAGVGRSTQFRSFLEGMPRREVWWIILPCVLFILWSGLSAIWATSAIFALYHTSVWISYLAFYCFFRYYQTDTRAIERWMIAFMAFLWVICLPPLFEYYTYVIAGEASTIGLRYSKYTELANTLVPLVAAYAFQAKGRAAYLGFATVVLVWLFDIAALSRTGIGIFVIVTSVLVLLTFLVPSIRQFRAKAMTLAATLVAVTILSAAALVATVGNVPIAVRVSDPSTTDSSNIRPLFLNIALEMWREKPFLGIGADNYGLEFSRYRRKYAERSPQDPGLKLADDQLAERAHNEYAQILAELGIAGLGIFAVFLCGIACSSAYIWRMRGDISLNTVAALIGVGAFLASSLVTSYSFRIFQNGLMFVFVLAVAISGTFDRLTNAEPRSTGKGRGRIALFVVAAAFGSSICLAAYCLVRAAAVHEMLIGAYAEAPDSREAYFRRSLALDPENAITYRAIALSALNSGDPGSAAKQMRRSIDHGQATTTDYSYLATAHVVNGDLPAAAAAILEALQQYPYSTFLRVRYGVILREMGEAAEGDRQLALANGIDARQAATWRVFLESGSLKASQFAFETNGPAVMALRPPNSIYAVQKERELRFPEEKFVIPR